MITADQLSLKVEAEAMMARSISEWRSILPHECQVYVFGENYLAKRFDQINYQFCDQETAKQIVVDNLYSLLRYKYFKILSEEADERIAKIVSSFTANLKSTLIKVSFDQSADGTLMRLIPDWCIAFKNGVYDFKNDEWLFKYEKIKIENLSNIIYTYNREWVIMWYLDYDFEPLELDVEDIGRVRVNISDIDFDLFVQLVEQQERRAVKNHLTRNYCFELAYNICHDASNRFSMDRMKHFAQVLGYSCLQSFAQFFIFLIGAGQNGKNSLFDGCFSNRLIPRPAANDLKSIENDRFITGALENRSHNIFLETDPEIHTQSKMIKALTGSEYQTIERKGVNKYSSVINCRYIFSGNDQDRIKFTDTTTGFRRRINMFEIWYQWDSLGKYKKLNPNFFDTTFSSSLKEIKSDPLNTTMFVYLAMYGIMEGTKNFTENFQFHYNDWNERYTDIDTDFRGSVVMLSPSSFVKAIERSPLNYEEGKAWFYSADRKRLYLDRSVEMYDCGCYDDLIDLLRDPEKTTQYFSENDIYISIRAIQKVIGNLDSAASFTATLKKSFNLTHIEYLYNNKPYVKVTFANDKLIFR